MTVLFKLTKPNGLTRRITFGTRPTWPTLSAKISALYDIAIENVGVSYVDSDGDNVTLSSDDELQDFYMAVSAADNGTIKLAVHDLSSLRAANTASHSVPSAIPQQSHFRNTFGGHEVFPLAFEAEDEWQRLPGNLGSLFLSNDAPESPHAFVEVLESDVSLSKSEATDSGGDDASRSDLTFTPTASQNKNKGKERAPTVEDDVSSVDSVIGNEAPAKPPVHVLDMSLEDMFGRSPRSVVQLPRSGTATPAHVVFEHSPKSTVHLPRSGAATPAQAQSTPVIPAQPLEADVSTSTSSTEQKAEVLDDDPPLPSLDLPDPDRVSPSLTQDVATLLTTISAVISTHPELSEHLRNIIVNATNGTYWNAHRDAISRAAENLQRTTLQETSRSLEEIRHATEQEASTRVTEAIGSVFRTVGGFVPVGQANSGSQASRNPPQAPTSDIPRPPHNVVSTSPRFPHLPPHPRRNHHSWFSQPPFAHPGSPFWSGLAHPHPPPPPPPPPPPHPPHFPLPHWPRPPPPRFWGRDSERPPSAVSNHDARATARQILATAAEARTRAAEVRAQTIAVQPSSTPEATPEELRAEVEKAKADYKARKERYRQAKAIRKMAEQSRHEPESATESLSRQTSDNPTQAVSENKGSPVVPTPALVPKAAESTAVASEVHIVSNARGPYPQLEMFSVPKRSHTTGHMPRGHVHENKETRPFNRIMRKLSDMGFTEGAYPNLNGKVMDQLLSHPPVSKDTEDDIVTNLIEELVSGGGGGANASGSGGIPGAWH